MTSERTWPTILQHLLAGDDLGVAEATWAMRQVMDGAVTPGQLGAFLVALRAKGEATSELIGFRDAVLEAAVPLEVPSDALDIVGTGGDGHRTVNVSTTAAIVIAALGIPVVKHGNRAASSQSGSSDVLGELGISLTQSPDAVARAFAEAGITFVHAASFHPGFRHAGPVRAELGVPTVFNMLGPLVNPARPDANAVGVASLEAVPLITGVLRTRGATALVFRGDDGLDELTVTGYSRVWEISRGDAREFELHPRDLGLRTWTLNDIRGGTPAENADVIRRVLAGEPGAVRDIVVLNAAAGIVSYRLSKDAALSERSITERLTEAIADAGAAIDDGRAAAKLAAWVAASSAPELAQ